MIAAGILILVAAGLSIAATSLAGGKLERLKKRPVLNRTFF